METTKSNMGCAVAAIIGMIIGCLFIICVGIFAFVIAKEPAIAYLCGGIGVLGLIGFTALGIVMIRQSKHGVTSESKRQWDSGILTDKVVKKDLYSYGKTVIIGWFAMTGVLLFFAIMALCFAEEITLTTLAVAGSPLVTLVLGTKAIIQRKQDCKYRIEEDRVVGAEVKTTFDVVDAVTTHLPTKTPVFYLEKHGEYKINAMHIHPYYPAEELVSCVNAGEEIYVVYSVKTNKLLHIYRKKYWHLEEN